MTIAATFFAPTIGTKINAAILVAPTAALRQRRRRLTFARWDDGRIILETAAFVMLWRMARTSCFEICSCLCDGRSPIAGTAGTALLIEARVAH